MQETPPEPPPSDPVPDESPAAEAAVAAPAAPATPREGAIADLAPAACAALLAERFPALFGIGRPLPIKLRIQADIQQRAPGLFNKKSLSIFLHRHTTSTAYIKALLNAPHRFDLDGQAAGEIAQEHRDAAVAEMERRLAIVQARRVAERDAQRQAATARRGPPAAVPDVAPAIAAEGDAAPRPARFVRPPRGENNRPPRPDRPPRREPAHEPALEPAHEPARPRPAPPEAIVAPPAAPLTPEQAAENEARRSRAALLRSFETTTLTRANFCALKGMKEAALEVLLVQAREERLLAPSPPPPPDRERERPPQGHRRDERGPRPGRPPR